MTVPLHGAALDLPMLTAVFYCFAKRLSKVTRLLCPENVRMKFSAVIRGITEKRFFLKILFRGAEQPMFDTAFWQTDFCRTAMNICVMLIFKPLKKRVRLIQTAKPKSVCVKCLCSIWIGLCKLFLCVRTQ